MNHNDDSGSGEEDQIHNTTLHNVPTPCSDPNCPDPYSLGGIAVLGIVSPLLILNPLMEHYHFLRLALVSLAILTMIFVFSVWIPYYRKMSRGMTTMEWWGTRCAGTKCLFTALLLFILAMFIDSYSGNRIEVENGSNEILFHEWRYWGLHQTKQNIRHDDEKGWVIANTGDPIYIEIDSE